MVDLVQRARNKARRSLNSAVEKTWIKVSEYRVRHARVDPRITYPSFMSLDQFIDFEKLKSLDSYLSGKILAHMKQERDEEFDTGIFKLGDSPRRPGSRIIYLSKSRRPYVYWDLDVEGIWDATPAAADFALLTDFIVTLPFKYTARMIIMYDDGASPVTAHRDHALMSKCHEFFWFRPNMNKPFYVLNPKTGEKKYVGYSAWFDSCNQYHGADAHEGLSVSIRVDGKFTDEFRAMIPKPRYNVASTPSLWACTSGADH